MGIFRTFIPRSLKWQKCMTPRHFATDTQFDRFFDRNYTSMRRWCARLSEMTPILVITKSFLEKWTKPPGTQIWPLGWFLWELEVFDVRQHWLKWNSIKKIHMIEMFLSLLVLEIFEKKPGHFILATLTLHFRALSSDKFCRCSVGR